MFCKYWGLTGFGCHVTLTMAMLIRYQNGIVVEAVILSLLGDTLRAALKDGDDVAEFRLVNGVWLAEDFEVVTFDFSMSVLAAVGIVPGAELRPATMPSGSSDPLAPANIPATFLN